MIDAYAGQDPLHHHHTFLPHLTLKNNLDFRSQNRGRNLLDFCFLPSFAAQQDLPSHCACAGGRLPMVDELYCTLAWGLI